MTKPHIIEPFFQGTRGTHGDFNPKDWGSKAPMGMYRTIQLSSGVGLPSKNPWLINMNSWLKPREKRAAKRKLMSCIIRQRSQTKQAIASGSLGVNSGVSPEQMMLGVKRKPTDFVIRLSLGTLETSIPAFGEMVGEIGSKQMLQVMLEIGSFDSTRNGAHFP